MENNEKKNKRYITLVKVLLIIGCLLVLSLIFISPSYDYGSCVLGNMGNGGADFVDDTPDTLMKNIRDGADKVIEFIGSWNSYFSICYSFITGTLGLVLFIVHRKNREVFTAMLLLCIFSMFLFGLGLVKRPHLADVGYKPVLYLYGYDGDVTVKFDNDMDFVFTYPEYKNGWNVKATSDGVLTDKSGRKYNYLFWEFNDDIDWDMSKGFCVKNTDLIKFFEDKLAILGLNDSEANDFITFWVPKMQDNQYNVITFQMEDYTDRFPISISEKPDTVIRFYMTWYGSDKYIDIAEQKLIPMKRSGKTIIEWGGRSFN